MACRRSSTFSAYPFPGPPGCPGLRRPALALGWLSRRRELERIGGGFDNGAGTSGSPQAGGIWPRWPRAPSSRCAERSMTSSRDRTDDRRGRVRCCNRGQAGQVAVQSSLSRLPMPRGCDRQRAPKVPQSWRALCRTPLTPDRLSLRVEGSRQDHAQTLRFGQVGGHHPSYVIRDLPGEITQNG
jgi:hypothetical protein